MCYEKQQFEKRHWKYIIFQMYFLYLIAMAFLDFTAPPGVFFTLLLF